MAEKYKTFAIALDMKITRSGGRLPHVYTGDTGNKFVITLTDDGVAYDLSTARVAAVFARKGGSAMQTSWAVDGGVVVSGASNNIVTITLKSTSYGAGTNTCQLQILSGTLYDTVVTSTYFNFEGESPAVNDNTIESSNEYTILTDIIADVQKVHDNYASDVQSDWEETNDTLGTFIVNKPVVGTDIQQATQGLTAETTLAATDTIPFYDASATAHRKTTWANLVKKIFGSITGLVKADGVGNISAAVSNTDYAAATHASRHAVGAADAISGYATLDSYSKVTASQAKSSIFVKTESYELTNADAGCLILMNVATPNTVTVPLQSTAFVGGDEVEICQIGAGETSIVGAAGVTILSLNSLTKIAGRYGVVTLKKMSSASEGWLLAGALKS